MDSTTDFGGFEFPGQQPLPAMPPITAASVPANFADKAPGASEIYAAAWTMAQRDHELDKLFNAQFYQK